MTSTDLQVLKPSAPHGRRLRTAVVVAAALLSGGVGGAGGFAMAAGPWQGGMHGHHLERLQRVVHGALDSVGASTVQEDKIHDILAANFADGGQNREQRVAMRKQMLDLLRAPTIDRAAVEKLRGDQVAAFDAHSKKVLGAILDAADQLTPDQRAKLADRFEEMAQHRHGMGEHHWHDGMGGPDHGPMDHGLMDRGPGEGRPDHDDGPDKG